MPFTTASSAAGVPFRQHGLRKACLGPFLAAWVLIGLGTPDRANWWTESTLTILSIGGLAIALRRLSDARCRLRFASILLHIYGAMHSCLGNPFGYWLKDALG